MPHDPGPHAQHRAQAALPPRRALVHAGLASAGGARSAGELARALGMERKTAEYHLHCLVRLGLVRMERGTDGIRRFCLPKVETGPDLRDLVLARIRAQPGLSTGELGRALGVSHTRVDRRVKDLILQGLAESTPLDGTRRIFPRA